MLLAVVLASAVVPARVSAGVTHVEEGEVLFPAPVSDLAGGVTENNFALTCSSPPATQGFDAWVFEVPDGFAGGPVRVSGDGPLYDFDVYFYTAECDYIADTSMATPAVDEQGKIPADAAFAVADLYLGVAAVVQFCAGDLGACPPVGQAGGGGGGGGASPTPAPSPSAAPSAAPSASPEASPSPTPTPTPASSPTEAAAPSPTPQPRGRAATALEASSARVTHGEVFKLRGKLFLDPGCGERDDYRVVIERRRAGSDRFVALGRDIYVNPDGRWSLSLRADVNASYRAVPAGSCEGEAASPVVVLVRARVRLDDLPARCKPPLTITGALAPNLAGTVVLLQRRTAGQWQTADRVEVDGSSRFGLKLSSCGAPHRVVWPTQGENNVAGRARVVFN